MDGSVLSGGTESTSRVSVGAGMLQSEVLGAKSGSYAVYTERLVAEVRKQVAEKAAAAGAKKTVLLPMAMEAEAQARVSALFPEFRCLFASSRSAVHAEFEAERCAGMVWSVKCVKKYSHDVVVLGDYLLNAGYSSDESAHLEFSPTSPIAVHADFQAGHDFARLAVSDNPSLKKMGIKFPELAIDRFLTRKAYVACHEGLTCRRRAGAYVADLSMYPMTQEQFIAGMEQAGAGVGVAMVPFRPSMMLDDDGKLGETGIGYSRQDGHLRFFMPEGQVIAERFPGHAWHSWLSNSYVARGDDGYVVELLQVRGNFVYAMMTKVEGGLKSELGGSARHVLEYRDDIDRKIVVVCDELTSKYANPNKASSWKRVNKVYDRRLFERLYHYGMSLKKEDFAGQGMQALLKRAYVGDNRVTFGGGHVDVQAPLTVREAHSLVAVVFARVFVDRYNMSTLGSTLMEETKKVDAFVKASNMVRVALVLNHYSFAAIVRGVRCCLDFIRSLSNWVRQFIANPRLATPTIAPMVVVWDFNQVASAVTHRWAKTLSGVSRGAVCRSVRGARQLYDRDGFHDGTEAEVMPPVPALNPAEDARVMFGNVVDELVDMSEIPAEGASVQTEELVATLRELDDLTDSHVDRFVMQVAAAAPNVEQYPPPVDFDLDAAYVGSINEAHEFFFPGMAAQNFEQDPTSLVLDPQDRHIDTDGLRLSVVNATNPLIESDVFKSRLTTYAAERRVENTPEMLSAVNNRVFSAAIIAEPQSIQKCVEDAWDNFLDMACVSDAREILAGYQNDPVGLEADLLREWGVKQPAAKLAKVLADVERVGKAVEEIPLHEYFLMLKADAKPPMSDKPLTEQVAPQTIAFQDKHASAVFSSLLRLLTRRFLALLKPNWSVSILKDVKGVCQFVANSFPWESAGLVRFLENDFSKFDKSQNEFCTRLKLYVYEQLGMGSWVHERWAVAQKFAIVRSMALGMEYVVHHQQKSGDGATSFANVLVNIVSVCMAYKGTAVDVAVFVGDDSFVVTRSPSPSNRSVNILAQVCNLQAKFIYSKHLYFASHFFSFDYDEKQVRAVPDPIKRSQRFAQSRSAQDPKWEEMYVGVTLDCEVYRRRGAWVPLIPAVLERYGRSVDDRGEAVVTSLFNALATGVSSYERFRAMWGEEPTAIRR